MISGKNICDIFADELSDGPIASDSSAVKTILKYFGCDIYLREKNRTRRKTYPLAGIKNSDLRLFISEQRSDLLAKRNVLFYSRSIEGFDFICASCRQAFIYSRKPKRQVGESQNSITLTRTVKDFEIS